MDNKTAAIDTFYARVDRLKAEIEETCKNPEGASSGDVVKAVAYYMIEADSDLEGSFREFDRMLEDIRYWFYLSSSYFWGLYFTVEEEVYDNS